TMKRIRIFQAIYKSWKGLVDKIYNLVTVPVVVIDLPFDQTSELFESRFSDVIRAQEKGYQVLIVQSYMCTKCGRCSLCGGCDHGGLPRGSGCSHSRLIAL